jgi:hypothetical protein
VEKYQIIFLSVIALLGVFSYVFFRLKSMLKRWRMQRRFARGRVAESEAALLLVKQGFEILQDQCNRECRLDVNGEILTYNVRVDFIVKAGNGDLYAAEVKSGKKAPNPLYSATRRQLLEYQNVYNETSGVLLVDMSKKQIQLIKFLF